MTNHKNGKLPMLGHKGAPPPRKHKNPRLQAKTNIDVKYFNGFAALNNHNVVLARSIIHGFKESNDEEYQSAILNYWIGVVKIKERMARSVFGIGHSRYVRSLNKLEKKKPGGRKPNWVSQQNCVYYSFINILIFNIYT